MFRPGSAPGTSRIECKHLAKTCRCFTAHTPWRLATGPVAEAGKAIAEAWESDPCCPQSQGLQIGPGALQSTGLGAPALH